MKYYAVAVGRQTGIFTDWEEAKRNVNGFANAKFKSFKVLQQAQIYLDSNSEQPKEPIDRSKIDNRKRKLDEDLNSYKSYKIEGAYYAVAKGHIPGIYGTWEEAQAQINTFDTPKYKKFSNEQEAKEFIATESQIRYVAVTGAHRIMFSTFQEAKRNIEGKYGAFVKKFSTLEEAKAFSNEFDGICQPDPFDASSLVAFCDGSASKNGKHNCKAGYACLFPHNPEWDVIKKISEGKKTNNCAEYLPALEALKRANLQDPSQSKPLTICTDSKLLITSMKEYIRIWKKNGWRTANNTPVQNQTLLKQMDEEIGKRVINWIHVPAHTGKKDWFSRWNDKADQAAKLVATL
jgi:ribonuclease HI